MIKIRVTPPPCQISLKSFTGLSSRGISGNQINSDATMFKRGGAI